MPTQLNELFISDYEEGTHKWNVEIFRRAYLYPGGPFERVVNRIRTGFSVLVYLPGNCMRAAAQILCEVVSNKSWTEYGLPHGKTQTIADIWKASTMISGVMGTGPVPTFAPPFVPVGPVVAGSIVPTPGVLK